jgi:hypothetical protein
MAEGKAPTPFTAAQIREASPNGRVTTLRLKNASGTYLIRFSFGKCDAESTTFETVGMTLEEKPLGNPTSRTVKWTELQSHASYDQQATTITEESVTVPFGKFDSWVYTVKKGEELHRYCFAKALPGPPIRVTAEKAGETIQTMEMVRHRCFDYEKVFGPQKPGPTPAKAKAWSAVASVQKLEKSGDLKVVASLTGAEPPLFCKLEVTSGALKGALLNLAWDRKAQRLTCEKQLPAGFRMTVGKLTVRVVSAESAK